MTYDDETKKNIRLTINTQEAPNPDIPNFVLFGFSVIAINLCFLNTVLFCSLIKNR